MTEATDRLLLCQQMLGELGTRSTITSISPPDGSTESFYCNLFYDTTLHQVLRAANWNFAQRTDIPQLWKALPGTPENPTIPPHYQWSNRNPAPPWLYSYVHNQPGNTGVLQIRRVREGAQPLDAGSSFGVPFFGGAITSTNYNQLPCVRFEVALDGYDRAGQSCGSCQTITAASVSSPGSGYQPSDYITMIGDAASLTGQPAIFTVNAVNLSGGITSVGLSDGGTFAGTVVNLSQSTTTGGGVGFQPGITLGPHPATRKIILTNARNIIVDITASVDVEQYDSGFQDAFMLAMEGKLALALLGDKAMYKAKLEEANGSIIQARIRDGNEGLTIQDHVPDWLQVRGVASMTPVDRYFPAYGPLFAV